MRKNFELSGKLRILNKKSVVFSFFFLQMFASMLLTANIVLAPFCSWKVFIMKNEGEFSAIVKSNMTQQMLRFFLCHTVDGALNFIFV